MSMCACVGYVCTQVDAAKKEDPGPEVKKEDKEDPTTAAIPSALSEDQKDRLIATGSSASLGPKKYRAMYYKAGLFLNSCAYFLGIEHNINRKRHRQP